MNGSKHGLKRTLIFISAALILACCYNKRPDELQPEEIQMEWNKLHSKHTDFTQGKVLMLNEGMTAVDVEALFGPPDRTLFRTYWYDIDRQWQGLVYEYHMGRHPKGKYRTNTNTLVFSIHDSPSHLVHWDIQLAYPSE
jgi:hypothetical protein